MPAREDTSDYSAPPESGESKLSPAGIQAMRGDAADDPPSDLASSLTVNASEFKPETQKALRERGLDDYDAVLADNSGKSAEALTQEVLKHDGLPDGNGGKKPLKDVLPGHYDESGHGLDLVGVAQDGRPVLIEVKKRANPDHDSVGNDTAVENNLEPQTRALRDDILREREVNPALRHKQELADSDSPDWELSTDQMAGLWARDRWLKLVNDPDSRQRLAQAGVSEEYLNPDNLRAAYSPQWQAILKDRTAVIVSSDKDDVSNTLYRQAVLRRGFNVVGINLKA